jgi:phosphoglycolate phosphatase-like HAD superfamily hydrolase
VVGGDDLAAPKPAPAGLLAACARLGVGPARTAYVGDAEVDVRGADAAGAVAIHARWGAAAAVTAAPCLVARHPRDVVTILGPVDPAEDSEPAT